MPQTGNDRPGKAEIKRRVESALNTMLCADMGLLARNASERSISHKLAEHLQTQFSGWQVDCEYNRQGDRPKTLPAYRGEIRADDLEAKTVFPDVIVHRRGTSDNLLVIEIKKSTNAVGSEHDIAKLKAFTGPDYNYDLGLFIVFDVYEKRAKTLRWFQSGEECDSASW